MVCERIYYLQYLEHFFSGTLYVDIKPKHLGYLLMLIILIKLNITLQVNVQKNKALRDLI